MADKITFSRRYSLQSGYFPTATKKGSNLSSWKNHSGSLLTVKGVDWDGKPNFGKIYPIKGSNVWYQQSNSLKTAEKNFSDDVNNMNAMMAVDPVNLGMLQKMFTAADPAGAAMLATIGPAAVRTLGVATRGLGGRRTGRAMFDRRRIGGAFNPTVINPDDNPMVQVFERLFDEYRNNSAKYSKMLSNTFKSSLEEKAGKAFSTRDTPTGRFEAHPSRAAFEEQESPEEGAPAIGKTQPFDAYIKVGGKIVGVDITQQVGVGTQSKHHALTRGQLMSQSDYEKSSPEQIRKRMREYYNNEIAQTWNPTIQNLKEMTREAYGTEDITAEQLRNPLQDESGSTPVYKLTMNRGRLLSDEMTATHGRATLKHLMHRIGNWNSISAAGSYDSFALQHKPYQRTAGVLLRNFLRGGRKFEFKNVRHKDTHVFDGPFLYNIAKLHGYYQNTSQQQFVDDATAKQLVRKTLGAVGGRNVNAGSAQAIYDAGRPKVGMNMIIPDFDNDVIHDVVKNMTGQVSDNAFKNFHKDFQKDPSMGHQAVSGKFQSHLDRHAMSLNKELGTAPHNYRFWASPFYGLQFVGDTRPSAD